MVCSCASNWNNFWYLFFPIRCNSTFGNLGRNPRKVEEALMLVKRLKRILPLLVGALFFFILGGVVLSKSFSSVSTNPSPSPTSEVKSAKVDGESAQNLFLVSKVVDGDTIQLENGRVVRYIGVDTPETKDPRTTVQCYGQKASEENKKLVEGKMVKLEKDISETDRYDRLLRYVYVDGIFVNDHLVKEGYARSSSYPPDIKYQEVFRASEEEARNMAKGLWLECASSIERTTTPSSQPSPAVMNNSNIECSKNAYNCSSFKTQSEAQSVFDTCGGTSNDVHKLDRDGDGRVCETLP